MGGLVATELAKRRRGRFLPWVFWYKPQALQRKTSWLRRQALVERVRQFPQHLILIEIYSRGL